MTNSVPIASQLAQLQNGPVHLLGGRVRGLTQATVGGETVEALGRLHCDVVFLGTNGLTPTHGLSTPDPDEAAVKRAMVRSARRKVVLADSSKVQLLPDVSKSLFNRTSSSFTPLRSTRYGSLPPHQQDTQNESPCRAWT